MLSIPPAPPFTRNEWFLWITNSFGLFCCFLLWQWRQADSVLNLELNTVIGTCFIALLLYCFVELTLNWYLNLESITATGDCFIMWPFCDVNMNCLNLARFLWFEYWINSLRVYFWMQIRSYVSRVRKNDKYDATKRLKFKYSWKKLQCSVEW